MIYEQLKHPKIFFLGIISIVILMSFLSTRLELNSNLDALIPDDGEFNSNEEIVRRGFDLGDGLLILINLDKTSTLKNSVTDIHDLRIENYGKELIAVLGESQYVKTISPLVYSDDGDLAKITLEVRPPEKIGGDKAVKEEIEFLIGEVGKPTGVKVQLTGMPLLIDKISSLLIQDNLTTILLTLVFIFLVLLWYFRNLLFVIIVLATPVMSLIILSALMVLFGISITIPLAAVGVLVLGLGVDYSIHIAVHYQDERKKGKKHGRAIIAVVNELKLPITASFLTTLAGFAALLFGVSPSTQDQGAVLSIAIAVIYAVTFVAFPVLLTLFLKNSVPKTNNTFEKIKLGLAKLAGYQFKHSKIILTGLILITFFMFYGMSLIQFSTSNSNWIPDTDPLSIALREDSFAFGDNDYIFVIIKSTSEDLRNFQVIKDVKNLESDLRVIPNVDVVNSIYTDASFDKVEYFNYLTNSEAFNEDYTLSLIKISTQDTEDGADGTSRVLKDIREVVDNHPIYHAETLLFGDQIRFEELSVSLQQDAAKTTMMGILLVFVVASLMYASITVGLVALIPIIIGLIWAIGMMGFFGVPFTSLSTGIVSLVLGIGVDFSIHLIDGIKRYQKKYGMEESLKKTLISSGTSILLASITTFIGFIALTFSQLLGTQRLGWSLALSVLSVFIVAILTVPVIMKITQVKK